MILFLYSVFIFLLVSVFLCYSYKNRFSLFYLFINLLSFTHVVGIIIAEFFNILEIDNLSNQYSSINGASAIYLMAIIVMNIAYSKTISIYKDPLACNDFIIDKLQISKIGITTIFVFYFFIPILLFYVYLLNYGNIPLFNGGTDTDRVIGNSLSNIANIFINTLMPIFASVIILLILINKKMYYLLLLIFALLVIYPILMAHKSLMILMLFWPLFVFFLYYGFKKIIFKFAIVLFLIFIYFLIMLSIHYSNNFSTIEIVKKLFYRLSVGQGTTFYLIWSDLINNNLPFLYDYSFLKHAFYSSVIENMIGNYIDFKGFEYEVALHYTSEWFASSWNLVTTFLGEPAFTFGIIGIIASILIILSYNMIIYSLMKYFLINGNMTWLVFALFLMSLLCSIWNMGGYYILFSINTIMLMFIVLVLTFVLNMIIVYSRIKNVTSY